jgi:3-hydroxyisobutyrate dehydrogenase
MPAVVGRPIRRVGFVGLGEMGGAIARRIIGAGWPTVLWARRPEALTGFEGPNVSTAHSAAELAAEVDVVGVCVWADDDVRAVVLGADGLLAGCRPGTVVAVHSTVAPATCRRLAETAEPLRVAVLDAPVTGGRNLASDGMLTVAVGGDSGALDRCRPVFAAFAHSVVHLGDVGTGQLAKLLNNAVLTANLAVVDDALTVGARFGLDESALATVLRGGSGSSFALDVAVSARASAATRAAAVPALQKDLATLAGELDDGDSSGWILRNAAAAALRRLGAAPDGGSGPRGR